MALNDIFMNFVGGYTFEMAINLFIIYDFSLIRKMCPS